MGIRGLLPLLKSIMVPVDVEDLRGCTVAVDTYSWLHKGALSCCKELCSGQPASKHIEYCMYRVNLLRHHGVKPILVFDGGLLPMKSDQETKRSRARKENLERALEHESSGNVAAAYECYQKAVDISPSIAFELIQVLKQVDINFIVAPYEADAQMTFLSLNKIVDAVITEDSDLIAFGCPKIIFKMDKFGHGVQFQYSMLQKCKDLSFSGFTKQMLLEMCIFSGCDYLQSLPGMGLKRAHALVHRLKSYDKVIKHLRYSAVFVPPSYEVNFKMALLTFKHQRVYDPICEDIVHLSDISNDTGIGLDFLGPLIPQHVARGIAQGYLDPFTKLPFEGRSSLTRTYAVKECMSGRKGIDLPAQKNVLTNYFCLASLEAKRKFIAPRLMQKPVGEVAENSSYETEDHVSNVSCLTQDSPCSVNCATGSLLCSEILKESNRIEGGLKEVKHEGSDLSDALGKDLKQSLLSTSLHGKTRTATRQVVRSRYFQPKLLCWNEDEPNENEKPVLEDGSISLKNSVAMERPSLLGTTHLKSALKKRKFVTAQNISTETGVAHCIEPVGIHPSTGANVPVSTSRSAEMDPGDGKFSCNISHLEHYSNIGEKTMDKFVSVISSFRFSSGSRVSGLRAPLKDLKSPCSNSSNMLPVDFSNFSYLPKDEKMGSSFHKKLK